MAETQRRLSAIMFTDMVGYSALVQADEAAALTILDRHNRVLRPWFERYRGREIKTVGDAFLVEFESALEAVQCALEIQRSLHEYNLASPSEWKIRIRIGIHVGDVVRTSSDVLGDAVNIASRIQSLAEPDGICITQQVFDQIQNKVPTPFVRLPPSPLKNIHLPVVVYRALQVGDAPPVSPTSSVVAAGHGLAVLPLLNISPNPDDAYFADGLTEELIAVLSQVRDLSVIARTSVAPYKSAPKSIAEVGADLHVDSVLEGSVRKAGNRLRITLQLIDVPTQRHIWASSYNREIDDVFAVQTDIAEQTAAALRLEFAQPEPRRRRGRPTENPAAYDSYLRGLVAANEPEGRGLAEATRCFEHATKLDPGFAEAYAAWANEYVSVAGDILPVREIMPRARELAARALELNPQSSEAHAALANIILQFDLDWVASEVEFREAITLNPSNLNAHRFYFLLLMALGRFEEAKDQARWVVQLDPRGPARQSLAWAELQSGNIEAALRYAKEIRDSAPSSLWAHTNLGFFCLDAGRTDEARSEADTILTAETEVERFDFALLNALIGRPERASEIAAEVKQGKSKTYQGPCYLAMLSAAIGEKERALDLLEEDYREGDHVLWIFFRGAVFDSLREDPRFIALLDKYGLPAFALPPERRRRRS